MPGLIRPDALWRVVEPVDIRRGVEGLSLYVQQTLGADPCDGSAYLFRNQRGTRLKLLVWDGNGVWLCQRRLHRGQFAWPRRGDHCAAGWSPRWTGNAARSCRRPAQRSEKAPPKIAQTQACRGFQRNTVVYIDNNAVENAIRPIAVGKKNWLFAGSERAGQRAAVIQSLMGTAKPNGRDPAAWLQETLDRLPTWPNSRLYELLPLRCDQKTT